MLTLGLENAKGGTGKTNCCTNLAVAGIARGQKVWLVDADPLGDCTQWAERRGHDPDLHVSSAKLQRLGQIKQVARAENVDLLIVDTAGGASIELRTVADLFDVILVPVGLSAYDLPRSVYTKQLIESTGVPCPFVLNRVQRENTERVRVFLDRYSGFGSVVPFSLPDRVAFPDSFATGQGIIEYAPQHAGTQAIVSLFDHIMTQYPERKQNA